MHSHECMSGFLRILAYFGNQLDFGGVIKRDDHAHGATGMLALFAKHLKQSFATAMHHAGGVVEAGGYIDHAKHLENPHHVVDAN